MNEPKIAHAVRIPITAGDEHYIAMSPAGVTCPSCSHALRSAAAHHVRLTAWLEERVAQARKERNALSAWVRGLPEDQG